MTTQATGAAPREPGTALETPGTALETPGAALGTPGAALGTPGAARRAEGATPSGSVEAAQDRGMATAEYAIATVAACGFAGVLLAVLRSDQVRALLAGLVRRALSVG